MSERAATTVAGPAGRVPDDGQDPGWRSARRLLRGPLRLLITGQALGQGGDGLAEITFVQLVLFEIGRGATPGEIAGVLAATLLPFSLVGPFAGVVIDRWDRRRVMAAVSLVRVLIALGGVGAVALHSRPLAYSGILLLLSSSRFVLAAKGAALPRTVDARELVTANALSALVGVTAAFAGAVLGSTFVAAAPAVGFLGAAVAYALATVFFRRLPPVGGGEVRTGLGAGLRRAARELTEGTEAIAGDARVRNPLGAVWCHRLLLGGGFILLVLIADRRYHLEAPGYGLALAATGIAAVAGSLTAPVLARRHRPEALLPLPFFAAAVAAVVAGYASELWVLVAGVGVTAFAFQVLKVLVDALVGRATDDRVRGRVFAAYDVVYNVAFVGAGLVLVPLWRIGVARALFWSLTGLFVLAGLAVARVQRAWPFGAAVPAAAGRRGPRRWRWRLAALACGALPTLAFPGVGWWWSAWVALVPLLLLVRATPTGREGAIRAWWGAAGLMIAMHHWLLPNLGPFIVPVAIALAALWLPWGRVAWGLLHRPLTVRRAAAALAVLPSGWVVIESLRSWERLGGPWGLLGASQWNARPLLGLAALGGVWIVSLFVVTSNVAITLAVTPSAPGRLRAGAAAVALVAVAAGPTWWLFHGQAAVTRSVRVAVVQPGVVRGPQARFDAGEASTRGLAGRRVDLVVWGESSVGFDLDRRPDLLARLESLTRIVGSDILVNVDARRGSRGGIYKSSILVTADGPRGRYDKMRLVPFGEYVPMRFLFSWTTAVTASAREDRHRGKGLVLLHSAGLDLGPLVCFESAFPDMSRNLANRGADMIVVQSATSTFQGSWAPAQHASLAAVRAVESGRPVVHATLTGTSVAFDADGRELGRIDTHRRGAMVVTVPVAAHATPYDRFGEWVPAASFVVLGLAATASGLRRARRP